MCGQSELEDAVDAVVGDFSQDRMLTDVEVPAGLTLKTDRVGQSFDYANELIPGETVRLNQYNYDGEQRNVLVVKTKINSFEGLTLERNGDYRHYIESKYDFATVVEPFIKVKPVPAVTGNVKRVRFDEAGEALLASLSGEQLAELYNTHVALIGDGASFDADSGEVVVKLPEIKNRFEHYEGSSHHASVQIVNKRGQLLDLFIHYKEKKVGINTSSGDIFIDISPEMLRDELVKFLA